MNPKTQRYVLGGLVVLLVVVYFLNRSGGSGLGSIVAAPDAKFEPLKVEDPALRVYELDKVRKAEYKGAEHNIFVYGPPRPTPAQIAMQERRGESPQGLWSAASSADTAACGSGNIFRLCHESENEEPAGIFQHAG